MSGTSAVCEERQTTEKRQARGVVTEVTVPSAMAADTAVWANSDPNRREPADRIRSVSVQGAHARLGPPLRFIKAGDIYARIQPIIIVYGAYSKLVRRANILTGGRSRL